MTCHYDGKTNRFVQSYNVDIPADLNDMLIEWAKKIKQSPDDLVENIVLDKLYSCVVDGLLKLETAQNE